MPEPKAACRRELVELKTADEIFSRPGHPYTKSLVDSALALRRTPAQDRPPGTGGAACFPRACPARGRTLLPR